MRAKKLTALLVTLCMAATLLAAPAAAADTPIDPVLIFSAETNLTVTVDGTASDALSDTVPYGEAVTLTAPTVPNKTFRYWTNGEGEVISYSRDLTLTMYANTSVSAVYGASVTAKTSAAFLNVTRTDGEIVFNAIASATGNITGAGIRYSTTKNTLNDLKGTEGVMVVAADGTPNWTLIVTPTDENTTCCAVAYVTIGTETTYSAVKAVKLSELNYGVSMVTNLGDIQLPDNMNISFATVTFDANGGAGAMAPQGVVKGAATALNANTFTREGYTFNGWSTTPTGSVAYSDGASATISADTTLYAQWRSNSSGSSSSSSSTNTTTTTTTKDNTSNPDASTTTGTVTVSTTKNADGSTTAKTTETATVAGENGSKTEVKAESSTTTKSNTDGSTTATTTATQTATTTAADGTKTVTETKTEAKETLDKSGNGTVEAKTTETVKDASGKVTATTVTESKGTVSTATDGTKTTTTTNTAVTTAADGTKTTVVTTEKAVETTDGSTGKVVSDESGKVVSVEAKVSETAAENAAKSGEAVTLPVTVTAAQSAENATAVEITVPKDAESVKVEIPVEDVKPGTVAIIVHEDGTEEIVKTSTTSKDGVVLALESGASVKVVDNTRTFNDVSGSEWYADSVTWAVSNGVARGEGSSFGANDAVTREQLAVMLYNYAGMKGYRTSDRGDMSRFADNGRTSAWASDAMAWAVGVGILNGSENADGSVSLNPQGNASRAQVTAMTERFCGKAAK